MLNTRVVKKTRLIVLTVAKTVIGPEIALLPDETALCVTNVVITGTLQRDVPVQAAAVVETAAGLVLLRAGMVVHLPVAVVVMEDPHPVEATAAPLPVVMDVRHPVVMVAPLPVITADLLLVVLLVGMVARLLVVFPTDVLRLVRFMGVHPVVALMVGPPLVVLLPVISVAVPLLVLVPMVAHLLVVVVDVVVAILGVGRLLLEEDLLLKEGLPAVGHLLGMVMEVDVSESHTNPLFLM